MHDTPDPKLPKVKFYIQRECKQGVTRSSHPLNIPLFKIKFGQRSFQYRIVTMWNDLRSSLKLSLFQFLHGMPAGHDVSRFRSGIFFFIGVINVHINLCIKLCPPLVRIYCSDCLQQKQPNQNLFFRHISRERGPTHHFCVTSNHHLIYSLKLD